MDCDCNHGYNHFKAIEQALDAILKVLQAIQEQLPKEPTDA